MAALYAKAAGGLYSAASTWSTTSSAGVDNSGPPLASTDVIFELGSGAVTIDVASVCRSLDCTSGTGSYTGTLTHNSFQLLIGDGTAGAGNVAIKFSAGMTYTRTTGASLVFVSTNATQQSITFAGKLLANININGVGGSWQLQDNFSTTQVFTYTAGTLDTNSKTMTMTGSLAFNGGGQTYFGLTITAAGAYVINGANTFTNLTRTGTATTTDGLVFAANQNVTNSFTANGNSTVNRVLIQSLVAGTPITLTTNSPTITNADFQDITASGTGWDLHAITGLAGDCGGNSGMTLTTGVQQFWFVATTGSKNWNTAGNWFLATGGTGGAGRVPLPQDDARFDSSSVGAASQTISMNMPRIGRNINFTGVTNSPTLSNSTINSLYGSLTLVSGITLSVSSSVNLSGRNSYTLTNAGKTFGGGVSVIAPGGTYSLQDALIVSLQLAINNGTLDAQNTSVNANVTCRTFSSTSGLLRGLIQGSGIWSVTGNNTTLWNTDTFTNFTFTQGANNPFQLTYSGSTGSRLMLTGLTGASASNVPNFAITAGTDQFNISGGRLVGDLNFTGFAGTWLNNAEIICGNLTVSSGMTIGSGTQNTNFGATSGPKTITMAGKSFDSSVTFNGVGGSWQLQDDFTNGSTRVTNLTNGSLDLNGKNVSTGTFNTNNSNTRTLLLRGGTFSLTGTGTVWNSSTTGLTLTPSSSTIKITDTTNTAVTFSGGGVMFNNVWFSRGSSTSSITISGSNTFNDLKDDGAAAHSILFTAGTNNTVTTWHVSGTTGNLITLNSTTTGTFTLTKAGGGTVFADYLNIQHSFARPWSGAGGLDTWYAGDHSINNQLVATPGNGWFFRSTPNYRLRTLFKPSNRMKILSV